MPEQLTLRHHDLAQPQQDLPNGRVIALEQRQEFMSQPVAEELRVAVAWIAEVAQTAGLAVRLCLSMGDLQHRAHEPDPLRAGKAHPLGEVSLGQHPPQTRGAGAAQEMHQDRLGLVVRGMAGGDDLQTASFGSIHQEAVPRHAGSLLQRSPRAAHIPLADHRLQAILARQGGDILSFTGAFRPQLVVKVGDRQPVAEMVQAIHQAQAVRPTRNAYQNILPRLEQMVLADIPFNLLIERHGCAHYSTAAAVSLLT